MDLDGVRIVGRELARLRDPKARLPNAAEWAAAVRIIEQLNCQERSRGGCGCEAGDSQPDGQGWDVAADRCEEVPRSTPADPGR